MLRPSSSVLGGAITLGNSQGNPRTVLCRSMGNTVVPFGDVEVKEPDKAISFPFSKFLGKAGLEITDALLSALPEGGSVISNALKLVVHSASFDPDKNEVALLEELGKIIHKELGLNEVNVAMGKLSHVQRWLKNDYEPAVQSGHDCRKLHSMLEEKVNFLQEDVLSIVYEQKEFEEIGLKTFITAAAVHLAMLQEMARRDPETYNPEASCHAKSIAMYAPEYAKHAVRVAEKLAKERRDQVKFKDGSTSMAAGGYAAVLVADYRWRDEATGQEKGRCCCMVWAPGKEMDDQWGNKAMVERWCEEQKDKVADQLLLDLGQPIAVASKWKELEEKPVN